jgi:hypothetical protein
MRSSTFDVVAVTREHIALGYAAQDSNNWKEEPILAHGAFGSMGGLWTSARDLARYVAFLMLAFPPRDGPERGPVRRSSVREMQQAWRAQPASALRNAVDAPLQLSVSSYGYGLGISQDCRFNYIVGHGGGLPGYGSLMRWLPEYGVGLIALGNLTYAPFGGLFTDTLAALYRTDALRPRLLQPSPALVTAQKDVSQLITKWDDVLAKRIAADNLFLDVSAEARASRWRTLATQHGACQPASTIDAENGLRGHWRMICERGWLEVNITLAPTNPPRVQSLSVQSVRPPDAEMTKMVEAIVRLIGAQDAKTVEALAAPNLDVERMGRQINAASLWGVCKLGETVGGDGSRNSTVRLICERGTISARLALNPNTHRLASLDLAPTRDQRCVP